MAYSELIKSFGKIREYMNQFYVYGFKNRNEYSEKSARSYDNERRRIESWLGDHMSFRHEKNGKSVFIAMDSRDVLHNPLYSAFKAKSFTDNDITLHFYILDILADGSFKSTGEIAQIITDDYLSAFDEPRELDESTVRKKLKEYESAGLLVSKKQGNRLVFGRAKDGVDLNAWQEAVAFFSEENPLGVIGSYILDTCEAAPIHFSFKHHYILHALESEILYNICAAIKDGRDIEIEFYSHRRGKGGIHRVFPLKVYISTQGGRRYLMAYNGSVRRITFYRLDAIKHISLLQIQLRCEEYRETAKKVEQRLWGVSIGNKRGLDHIEMTVFVGKNEEYIVNRLNREKRCGTVERIDDSHYRFSADVYDAAELLPWIRTYIGRITKLECSDKEVVHTFYSDLREMAQLYGGGENAL